MKSVMISIKPYWVFLIIAKTIEKFLGKVIGEFVCDRIDTIRKRGIDDNFDYCYLSLDKWGNDDIEPEITAVKNSCVLRDDLNDYGENSRMLYGWHISNLKIYDEPKELSEFYKKDFEEALSNWEDLFSIGTPKGCVVEYPPEPKEEDYILTKAPQSWCYVEEKEEV